MDPDKSTGTCENRDRDIIKLMRSIICGMEADYKALSRRLHDHIGGNLVALMLHLQSLFEEMEPDERAAYVAHFEKILSLVRETIGQIRQIAKKMRPPVLDDFGLEAAIRETINDFRKCHPDVEVVSEIEAMQSDIGEECEMLAFRLVQAVLNNIDKHDRVDLVSVRLRRTTAGIRIRIRDNGIASGSTEHSIREKMDAGCRLANLKMIIQMCRGHVYAAESEEAGCVITALIPLNFPEA